MRFSLTLTSLAAVPFSATAQPLDDPEKGLALAQKDCSECHAVIRNDTRSPRPTAPAFQKIAEIPGMTGTALYIALQTPHRTMPNLMLEADELRDISAYILSLKEP
jgi:mono/diheme cytochrome c family protein